MPDPPGVELERPDGLLGVGSRTPRHTVLVDVPDGDLAGMEVEAPTEGDLADQEAVSEAAEVGCQSPASSIASVSKSEAPVRIQLSDRRSSLAVRSGLTTPAL